MFQTRRYLSVAADRTLIYLTAGPDGRMPPAAAVWQPAGSGGLENRGGAPLEAIAIELKDVSTAAAGGTPSEALRAASGASYRHASYGASYRVAASRLIDNSRVLVMKHRYAPTTSVDPLHFHSEDLLVVYLRGGYTWPAGGGWGANRVRRGGVDVIPANTLHTLGNAGSDPLELLVIIPEVRTRGRVLSRGTRIARITRINGTRIARITRINGTRIARIARINGTRIARITRINGTRIARITRINGTRIARIALDQPAHRSSALLAFPDELYPGVVGGSMRPSASGGT